MPAGARNDSLSPQFALRVRPVGPGSRRPVQLLLPADVVPSEMTFAPDGQHVLITHWVGDSIAQLVLADLNTGAISRVLADPRASHYQPVFAPDGRSLLAVREELHEGRWFIVSIPWPLAKGAGDEGGTNSPTVVLTSPQGVSFSTPIFMADGKRFLFHHGDALARATLDGKTIEALAGEFDLRYRDWRFIERARPTRPGWLPTVVTRYFAWVEWHTRASPTAAPSADVIIIDVQTKERRTVPLPGGVRVAVVVE
jgi:hypothetical protein